MSKRLGETIKEARKKKKITQKKLAEELGKVESTVRMWELGKNTPSPETLYRISNILELDYNTLMRRSGHVTDSLSEAFGFAPHKVEKNIFDIHSILNMNADVYYKNKYLEEEDKAFLVNLLDRTFSNTKKE